MENEEYMFHLREQLKRKTYPYVWANEELAYEYYEMLKKSYPEASIHEEGITQYICLDKRARKRLINMLEKHVAENQRTIEAIEKTIAEVKKEC